MASSAPTRLAIVTGSNTGIGKETARGLLAAGWSVILACRDLAKAEVARAELVETTGNRDAFAMTLDLGELASIRAFAAAVRAAHPRLELLINNAGVWPTKRTTTKDGFETTFGVNHLGTFLLTHELLPLLRASAPARIVVLSSSLHYRGKLSWDDLQLARGTYSGTAAYNQSKLCNMMFTLALARRLEGTGVTVNAVHPGVVATELARDYPRLLVKLAHLFLKTPAQGARCSLHVATAAELAGVSGQYLTPGLTCVDPPRFACRAISSLRTRLVRPVSDSAAPRPRATGCAGRVNTGEPWGSRPAEPGLLPGPRATARPRSDCGSSRSPCSAFPRDSE